MATAGAVVEVGLDRVMEGVTEEAADVATVTTAGAVVVITAAAVVVVVEVVVVVVVISMTMAVLCEADAGDAVVTLESPWFVDIDEGGSVDGASEEV